MPRLAERAAGTLGDLAPKAAGLLSVTGFAAAGVVSVLAENLRTLADRDEPLPDRAKQVAQNSIGAVLAGPSGLSQRGRKLVGRDDGSARTGSAHSAGTPAGRDDARTDRAETDSARTTAKAVAPAERPDRSKAEEARDRDADRDRRVTAGNGGSQPAADAPAEVPSGTADPDRSVEEQRAEQKAARKRQAADTASGGSADGQDGRDGQAAPEGLPDGVDDRLVADLQRMTVKQLRDRAAQDGVPGRSRMSKDDLVVALATRESEGT